MKKTLVLLLALFALVAIAGAQSLTQNSYYQKSVQLKAMADAAFEEGDYDAAADYAAQSQEYARLSDEYVARMLAIAAADDSIKTANEKLAWAERVQAPRRFAEDYQAASGALASAKAFYAQENYDEAKSEADRVPFLLMDVYEGYDLPASYTVREFPVRTDCLWRIAALPWVYNDPLMWPHLYKANKARMQDPSNPNLVRPGFVIQIPSINGEYRWGEWQPGITYPVFGAEAE